MNTVTNQGVSMTNVPLPLRVRIPAYLTSAVTALAGTPAVTYLAAEHVIDTPTTVFLGVVIAGIHVGADALALSHLTLPDEPDDQDTQPVTKKAAK
jgi:hypothetical protein